MLARFSRPAIAVLALTLLSFPSVYAQRGGRGGGTHSSSSAGRAGVSRGGARGSAVGTFGIQGRSSGFGHRGFFRGDRFFSPRDRIFGSFGFGYFPGTYLDYAYPYYPPSAYVLLDPRSEAQGVPWDTNELEQAGPQEDYWLISLNDETIILATDYWLEGSTLHYVTRSGKESSVDLSKVDLYLTNELNHSRGRDFELPHVKSDYKPQRRDEYGRPY